MVLTLMKTESSTEERQEIRSENNGTCYQVKENLEHVQRFQAYGVV